MKRIRILSVGKTNKPFCRDGCEFYLDRLKRFYDVTVTELPEQASVQKECELLCRQMSGKLCVLMDIGGEMISSEGLSRLVYDSHIRADEITFVIGGASGVDNSVRALAARRISFGSVTYPHQIAKMLLCEQLYRAATILNGLPYHK